MTGEEFGGEKVDLSELIRTLQDQVKLAHGGDLSRSEAMLVVQGNTLDLLFNRLTRAAIANMDAGYLTATETYMKLALRAQAQCRAIAETLHEMKNPRPVAFVQQANIANGPQQVNNGQASRAGEIQKPPNELLEQTHGDRLDGRATQSATAGDTHLATLGALDRPKV